MEPPPHLKREQSYLWEIQIETKGVCRGETSKKLQGLKKYMSARRVYVTKRKGDEVQEQIYLTPPSIKESYSGWFDPCPHPRPSWDGLEVDWEAKTFCNPPWRKIRPWVEKASKERTKGKEVHLLLPASPNTAVFHDLIFPKQPKYNGYEATLHIIVSVITNR